MKQVRTPPDAAIFATPPAYLHDRDRQRQARPVRGRPWRDARYRPRHLSLRHLVELPGASAVFAGAGVAPGRLDAVLGISKAYTTRVGGGPFPRRLKARLGDAPARGRRGVRQRDRASAAYRMVRRGARAPRHSAQRHVGSRADQTRRPDRHRSAQDLRRLRDSRETLRRNPPVAACSTGSTRCTKSCPAGARVCKGCSR